MKRPRHLFFVVLVAGCLLPTRANVFTSSVKMVGLSKTEELLLNARQNIGVDHNFLHSRLEARSLTGDDASSHPNGAYLLIKAFVRHWNNIIRSRQDLSQMLVTPDLPTETDLSGTLAGLLRLQRVYQLTAFQVYSGNFSGFTGPRLTPYDALALGQRAFTDGMIRVSSEWLTLAYDLMKAEAEAPGVGLGIVSVTKYPLTVQGQTLALLGRVYLRLNDRNTAIKFYHQSSLMGENSGDVLGLAEELKMQNVDFSSASRYDKDPTLDMDGMHRLCTRGRNQIVGQTHPYHTCRYKRSLHVPYRKYKEEILSLAPYASIFHDAVSDKECNYLKEQAKYRLTRAGLHYNADQQQHQYGDFHGRTAEFYWISDATDPIARRISRRVMDITWLEADDRNGSDCSSAEQLQVLNYGLGGHYSPHWDTFEDESVRCLHSGKRIATFLFYLEDVEEGGNTAFVDVDMAVPPVKGRGLFWFNAKPNGDIDTQTTHAGCPVLKGHKWIANKWIWTEGNMYRRPCGPKPDSSQLEVEKITYSRRHNIPIF